MRLIDADELMESIRKALGIKSMKKSLLLPAERTIIDQIDSAQTVKGWISVKDRLPEDETIVLAVVCYEVGWYRMFAWHDKHGWHSSADEFDERIDGDYVAFWLPIPEVPKEVKQSD